MDKNEHYRQVFLSFKELCAADQQPCSFSKYCRKHGVEQSKMRQILGDEFQNIRTLPGYTCVNSRLYATIYENFKKLCADGNQPGTFKDYCAGFGVSYKQVHSYLNNHKLRLVGLSGYSGPTGYLGKGRGEGKGRYAEVPFEDVIFEEAGFLPVGDANVITVSVDGHVAVRFPSDTDVAVIAKFVKKMGKEADHVES